MREEFNNSEAWHSRGYLPHYDVEGKYQMISYRLADSLPQEVLLNLENDLAGSADLQSALSKDDKRAMDKRKIIEKYLDSGYGSCLLKDSRTAAILVEGWKFFNTERYDLIAYVVMPNHVHLLIKTYEGWSMGDLVKSWKRASTKSIRRLYRADCKLEIPAGFHPGLLKEGKSFWQREYWDRFIRDERHYYATIDYIHHNPVKANLVKNAVDWAYSSCGKEGEIK